MKYSYRTYILLLTNLLLFSCRQEEPVVDMESGFLLTLGEASVIVDTRNTPIELGTPVADKFNVRIVRSTGEVIYNRAYTSQLIPASADSYTLTASYGTNVALGLDAPYYEGVATATVEKGKQTAVRIECGVANSLVTVRYIDANTKEESTARFDRFLSDYKVRIEVGNRGLYLPHDTKQSIYFPVGSIPKLQFQGVLREPEGKEVRYDIPLKDKEGRNISFGAGTHVIISLSYAAIDGSGAAITVEQIEVKTETISENIPVSWLPRPWVEGIGFEDRVLTHYETEEVPVTQLNFPAAIGLDDVKFTIAFDDGTYKSLNGDYVLSEMTDGQKRAFTDAGISLPEIGNPEKTTMDFTNLIDKLSGNPDTTVPTVDNIIKITGVTANNKEAVEEYLQDYKIAIKAKPVFSMPALDERNIWSKSFTSEDAVVQEGYANDIMAGIGYEYSLDGGNTWTSYNGKPWIDSVTDADKKSHHFGSSRPTPNPESGEDSNTVHVWARGKFRNFVSSNTVTFTLEIPEQIPNSNLDEWSLDNYQGSRYSYDPWAGDDEVKFWDTNNQFTTRHRTNSSSVTMANYNGMPAVSFVPGRSGWAAELRSTANGKANTRISSRWHSEKDYNKVAGELYTGTAEVTTGNNDANASSDTHTRLKNAEHPSRPTALKFFYKYQPHNGGSDACSALIQLLDSNKEVIIENTISGGGTVSDWTEITLPLNYVSGTLYEKCAYIHVLFCSTTTTGSNMEYSEQTWTLYKSATETYTFSPAYVGSVLTIDDIILVYDK